MIRLESCATMISLKNTRQPYLRYGYGSGPAPDFQMAHNPSFEDFQALKDADHSLNAGPLLCFNTRLFLIGHLTHSCSKASGNYPNRPFILCFISNDIVPSTIMKYLPTRRSINITLSIGFVLATALNIFSIFVMHWNPLHSRAITNTRGVIAAPLALVDFAHSEPVAMYGGTVSHYLLESGQAEEEWTRLQPAGGHLVYIAHEGSDEFDVYTVTLFHQLRCLDIIRRHYLTGDDPSTLPMLRHCFNYLRQTIQCVTDMGLTSAYNGAGLVQRTSEHICNDWTLLYETAEKNYDNFLKNTQI